MKQYQSDYATRAAEKRKLRIYATDPMSGRRAPYRITIEVRNEALTPGPRGSVVEVHDYDGTRQKYYSPVNLDDPALLMEAGLAPSESDPRFHQQMVYAVAMKVIDSAQRALGRPINFRRSSKRPLLRLFPHGFYGRNAFFDKQLNAILFGYFQADPDSPGQNIPNQTVFTCLSHDIIAHEMTHAIVHRLRPYFLEATNIDVLAFHEAFSDIVALFQRFSYRELLIDHIQSSHGVLHKSAMLVELAQQFGQAIGAGKSLRSAIGKPPDPSELKRTRLPHARGAILVSAVFAGYFKAYQNRTADLFRIAGNPDGRLHPDIVNRLATEASQLADRFLRMCFRAFDYMPPVDVTFGDFLRALITSDFELNPGDPEEVRFEIIEAFRERGIIPSGIQSLAEESLLWPSELSQPAPDLEEPTMDLARSILAYSAKALDLSRSASRIGPAPSGAFEDPRSSAKKKASMAAFDEYDKNVIESHGDDSDDPDDRPKTDLRSKLFAALTKYASKNRGCFGLAPGNIAVKGFHAVQRLNSDQRLVVEFVAQFTQKDAARKVANGGIPFRGGTTVIFGSSGEVRYIAAKPMPSPELGQHDPELQRVSSQRERDTADFIAECDNRDPQMAFADSRYHGGRMVMRSRFRALHEEG
jgi:hypothetical protein